MRSIGTLSAIFILVAGAVCAQTLPTTLPTDSSALSDAAATAVASDALSVESFDPEVVNQLIDQAPVDDATKTTLKQGVQAAADNPELLQGALDKVKSALGM